MKKTIIILVLFALLLNTFVLAEKDAAGMNTEKTAITTNLAPSVNPIDCNGISHPVVAIEVSKGQTSNDEIPFINDLTTAGYSVGTINIDTNPDDLDCVDVLIVMAVVNNHGLTGAYNGAEGTLLKDWVENGGGLIITADWGNYFSDYTNPLMNKFDANVDGTVSDSTHKDGSDSWVIFQSNNFANHPITAGVDKTETMTGGYFTMYESPLIPIITTDADAEPSQVPVVVAGQVGKGCAAFFGDSNWIQTLEGVDGYHKQNNNKVALNTVSWVQNCGGEIPEFPIFGMIIAVAIAGMIIFIIRRK